MRKTVVTTVLTAAASRDLALLATVKDDWGVTGTADDAFIGRSISRCSAAAEQFCNRVFAIETVQDNIALSREGWPHMVIRDLEALQLSRWPIAEVTSVTVDGKALTAGTDYIPDPVNGRLLRLDNSGDTRSWDGCLIVVVYSAGYVLPGQDASQFPDAAKLLPLDLEDAISRMVYTRFSERQRDPLIRSEMLDGVGRVEYIVPTGDGNLTSDVADILDNYRVPVLA
jgi:hypothetical protein